MKLIKHLNKIISFLPFAWVITTYLAALGIIIRLGRLPVWRQDNLEMIFTRQLVLISFIILVLILWTFPIWLGSTIYLAAKKHLIKRLILIYFIGILLVASLNYYDPFGILEFLYD